MIRVEAETGPAFLASALINGDLSSFDDEGKDQALMDRFLAYVAPGRVVSTVDDSDNEFGHLWIGVGPRFSGALVDYVIHYDE